MIDEIKSIRLFWPINSIHSSAWDIKCNFLLLSLYFFWQSITCLTHQFVHMLCPWHHSFFLYRYIFHKEGNYSIYGSKQDIALFFLFHGRDWGKSILKYKFILNQQRKINVNVWSAKRKQWFILKPMWIAIKYHGSPNIKLSIRCLLWSPKPVLK